MLRISCLLTFAVLVCSCASPQQRFDAAFRKGDVARMRKLPAAGVNIESSDAGLNTPLMLAVSRGRADMAALLIERGADVNARNNAGASALMLSADEVISGMLISKGADVNARNDEGGTALMAAASADRAGQVALLLEHGADAGARDESGRSALALAGPASVPALERAERKLVAEDLADGERTRAGGEPEKALSSYMAALGKLTRDTPASRETRDAVVALVRSLPEPPEFPEEARKHLVKSQYLLSHGSGQALVEAEILAALDAAPWWTEGYYNLGLVQGAQERYKDAIASLTLFIGASPDSPQAQAAQDKIYEFEIAQEQADKISGLAGRWTRQGFNTPYTVTVREGKFISSGDGRVLTASIDGQVLQGTVQGGTSGGAWTCTIPGQLHPATGRISDDAKSIEYDFVWSRYTAHGHCVNMAGAPSNCCLFCSKVCDGVNVVSTENVHVKLVR